MTSLSKGGEQKKNVPMPKRRNLRTKRGSRKRKKKEVDELWVNCTHKEGGYYKKKCSGGPQKPVRG